MDSKWLRTIVVFAAVGLAAWVILNPDLVYRPTAQAVLFILIALLPAILFASEASARFELNLPGFAASAGGAAAVVFIALIVLDKVASPQQYVAVYEIYGANDQPLQGLDRPDAVRVLPAEGGYQVSSYVDGNAVILIFPEQVQEATLLVRPVLAGPARRIHVSYDGDTRRQITLE